MVIRYGRTSPFLNQVMAGLLLELARLSLRSLTTSMLKLDEVAFAFGECHHHTLKKSQLKLWGQLNTDTDLLAKNLNSHPVIL